MGKTLTATLTGCTPTAATGGKGSGSFKSNPAKSGTIVITIKWTGTGTTTGVIKFSTLKTLGKCPVGKGNSRVTITGAVSGGTGKAVATLKKGQPIAGSVCLTAKGDTLEKGTALTF